ncbi:MAG: peptidase inhibitor family I36 protein [Hamadaea sp.]|uniref:peptidase inhibitor family I36 protein n=1 Tax=Hamadaea sp. TaxID=2024425 RepID=UPI0017DB3F5C|nr:peptidase inhibitor family I36 protein [Hamadaea sp.]NUR70861.1 peptidase inhibitor family I36 protein [Hamadaea sp.]NUT20884.1 peptidase inhibitor family I36 protein [Hamadaea sp.]
MKSVFRRFLGSAIAAGALVVASPLPAHAAASDCPSNYVCMWEDSGYSGDMWVRYERGTIYHDKFEIDGWDGDNEISSIVNNTNLYLVVFVDDNWNGTTKCINPWAQLSSLSSFWNDNIESFVLDDDCIV